jgi:predicted RNA-binding protein YlqC (UPF0109 family)
MKAGTMKSESLQGMIEYLANSLVDETSQVHIKEYQSGNQIKLELRVARDDMGRIIGRHGRLANSIRLLLNVAAARQGKQANLDIIEPL